MLNIYMQSVDHGGLKRVQKRFLKLLTGMETYFIDLRPLEFESYRLEIKTYKVINI
jgi:hypothetical protein